MLTSPPLASLRVSLNHRFTQSDTTSDKGTRVVSLLLLLSETLLLPAPSIFFKLQSFARTSVVDRVSDVGFVCFAALLGNFVSFYSVLVIGKRFSHKRFLSILFLTPFFGLIYLKYFLMSDKDMRSNPKEKPENLEGFTSRVEKKRTVKRRRCTNLRSSVRAPVDLFLLFVPVVAF